MARRITVRGRPLPAGAVVAAVAALVVAMALALTAGMLVGRDGGDDRGPAAEGPGTVTAAAGTTSSTSSASSPTAPPTTTSAPAPTTTSAEPTTASAAARPRLGCGPVQRAFTPQTVTVPGVTRDATVVTPPREAGNVPGTPPVTSAGKTMFAFDTAQGIRPGDPSGNVLLNAHTWPDGTALGNHLLAGLQTGDRIVVNGSGERLCYRVTERVEVLASEGLARYYAQSGPPQLALVVCSGQRLGPGNWTKRTVWFARPVA